MASGTINLNSTKSTLKGKIEWSSFSNGSNANSSTVAASLYIARTDGYTTKGTWNFGFNVAGNQNFSSWYGSVSSGWVCVASMTVTVGHNGDGTGWCYLEGYVNGPSGTSMSGYGVSGSTTVQLDTIPRYLNITSHYIENTGLNSITVRWTTDSARDWTQYSLNGATWTNDVNNSISNDNKSGTYTITGLLPNTQYSIRTRCRRSDSGLWTETGVIYGTTKDIAKISSADNFNFGDNFKVNITNPSKANVKLDILVNNINILSKNLNTGVNNIEFTQGQLDNLYKQFKNNNSVTINYIVTTNNSYTDKRNVICTLTGNAKTIKICKNGVIKRGKAFININGQVKRAVVWISADKTAKRCF